MAKIILTQTVPSLGEVGDVVQVKDGYARNYLVPRNYARPWTPGAQADIERVRAAQQERAHMDVETAQERSQALQERPLTVKAKTAVGGGRLFGTVKAADIAAAIEAAGHGLVDKRRIDLPHIKQTGLYPVRVQLHAQVWAQVKVNVVPSS